LAKVVKGDPEVDTMSDEEIAKYYEDHKGDMSIWSTTPEKIRRRRGAPSTIFSLRIAPEELQELQEAAVRQGRTVSDVIRKGALKEARDGAENDALREARVKARDLAETLERL
jgi:hypothetical protein